MAVENLRERYVVDEEGERVAVIVPLRTYEMLLEAMEELDCIRAYDAAKAAGDEVIPFEQALDEIAHQRR